VPRTDGFLVEKVAFSKFSGSHRPLQSCSECYHFKKWPQGGKETHFRQIRYDASTLDTVTHLVFWEKWKREFFWDMDGTLTGNTDG